MAGTIVVSTLVKIVGEKLGSALLKEISSLWGVENDLKALENTISTIRDLLDDAEQYFLKNKQVYNWLMKLKEIVYDADDLLDKIYLEAEKRKAKSYGQTSNVGNLVSHVNLLKPIKLVNKIKSINKRLNAIAAEKETYLLDNLIIESKKTCIENRVTNSVIDKDSILGRDDERENIVRQLKQIDGNDNVSIISIIGLGGMGKTTLAQLAYNEDKLNEYFHPKIWIYVSQDFNIGNIVRAMMDLVSKGECKLQNSSNLVEELQKYLNGKRFLIVLDDIWNENQEEWEKLKVILKCGAIGSKIIVTTRSMKVSEIMGSTSTIKLKGLSDEMSWMLFEQKAFNKYEKEPNPQILKTAKEIVQKCGGVPLALKALGSTMRSKKTFKEWLDIRDSEIWELDSASPVMASLRLSYSNFSSQLKECFTYCSILPKGQSIKKEELINQWIAQTRSMACMEVHKGNEYFEQLVQVCFLQNVVRPTYSRNVTCKMHDLVHDLAQSIAGQRFLLIKDTDTVANKVESCKYMSIVEFEGKMKPTNIKKVRALHIKGGDPNVMGIISKAQSMRAFFFERIKIDKLPCHISKLIHLRYIFISECALTLIPDDIGALWNLQALYLRLCEEITYLPESIGKLISLRTLKLTLPNLKCLPESIGQCCSLQNLIVNSKQIKSIPNSLSIQSLNISGCSKPKRTPDNVFQQFYSIRNIDLSNCHDLEEVPVFIGNLISLECLNLSDCISLKCLPESVGNLQNLCVMDLSSCDNLEEVPASIGNLVSLEILNLSYCKKLKYLPESVGNLQNLCVMNLSRCDNLEDVPASIGNLVSLEILNLSYCKKLKYLPESIGNLLNLDYLNLEMSGIETLPSGICELSNLVTLNLMFKEKRDLLAYLGNMKKLRYLHISPETLNGMPIGISKLTDMRVLNSFHVSRENKYASISELEHLNFLSEKLIISGLENLNNPREAIQANLKEKKNLDHLGLIWYIGADFLNERFGHWFSVLEALQPPSSIKSLDLQCYPGVEYPNWMVLRENNTEKFPYLTSLALSHFKKCSSLPSLARLPQLKYLELEGMLNLTTISGHFPSLVTLQLCEMPNLEEVTTMNLDIENVSKPAFPRLSELVISGCPKVRIQPRLPSSVVELYLEKINEEQLGVEFLNGESSSEICSQPLGIRELTIRQMETELVLLKHLSSLTRLQFENCERNCLPESMRHLSSLRELQIHYCKGLHALPEWLGELKSLEVLEIWSTPLITCLPESMKHVRSLRKLWFWDCEGLRVLPEWFGELKSLKYLTIWKTPLTCLPKSMKQLTALEYLSVWKCPELERRCEREKGEDWHLISHIPHVYINFVILK